MTKTKRIVALILVLTVLCSLCVMFVSCINMEEVRQKQQQIDELQAQLENKQKEIDDLKRESETSTYQLDRAKKDIKTLVGQLSELMEQDLETLSEKDKEIMKSYREPYLEENFEDNKVSIILKNRFVGLVGFKDFAVPQSVSEVIAIKHKSETIYKGSDEKFPIYGSDNHGLTLTLSTHDKEKVLEVVEILRKLDMVLIARPAYIYTVIPCSTPSDTNYSAQWGLNGNYGINVEGAV